LLEQRHRKALAAACGNGPFLMTEQCPPHVLGAAGGTQTILRPTESFLKAARALIEEDGADACKASHSAPCR
jgi:hypothetical protein